jgi:beta-glucosidase
MPPPAAGLLLVLALLPVAGPLAQRPDASVDSTLDRAVADLVARMTRHEKFWQLFMNPGDLESAASQYRDGSFGLQVRTAGPGVPITSASHAGYLNRIQRWFRDSTRLGIPVIPFEEALHGLALPGATAFPQAIALAATWDSALVARVADAIAVEARSRGIRQLLSPVVNITRDPRWGRTEESYGEDPRLASALGAAFVAAVEAQGVIATPKHLVANVGDGGRDSWPIEVSERQLREVWLPPFQAALGGAGARSVMTAYNSVDGTPASQSGWLLTDLVRGEWGFGGFVISDQSATAGATVLHMTEASTADAMRDALAAGMDVVFQAAWREHRPYLAAVDGGVIPDSVLDRAVARVLRAKLTLGLMDDPLVDTVEAARVNGHPDHRALAREVASRAMVLLTNRGDRLPLALEGQRVAVIGVDAAEVRLGGYSGPGNAPVSLLDALRRRPGGERVNHAAGPGRSADSLATIPASALHHDADGVVLPGLRSLIYDTPSPRPGQAAIERVDSTLDVAWTLGGPTRGIARDWYGVRWEGQVTAPAGGIARLGIVGDDGYRLWLDGRLLLDRRTQVGAGTRLVDVDLPAGSTHDIAVEFREGLGNARLRLVWDNPEREVSAGAIDAAAAIATSSEVAIVVVGIEEGEFRDRASLALPGHQEELIRRVAATGTPTVVVIVGGAPVTMSRWVDKVDAVLLAWYPGEVGGEALVDVLTGVADPGGRLPITFPVSEGQLPLYYGHKPTGRGNDYLDLRGRAAFPFGYGLSYTTFEYHALEVSHTSGDSVTVRFRVTNTGGRPGREVAQLYLRDRLASVAQPVLRLLRFAPFALEPGGSRVVEFQLGPTDFVMLDAELQPVVEAGEVELLVGRSSRHLELRGTVTLRGGR